MRDISRSYKKLWVISTTLFISLLLLSLTFSIKQSMNDEIQANSKELLGGDIQISSGIDPLSNNTIAVLSQLGQVSERVELGTMLTKQNFLSNVASSNQPQNEKNVYDCQTITNANSRVQNGSFSFIIHQRSNERNGFKT